MLCTGYKFFFAGLPRIIKTSRLLKLVLKKEKIAHEYFARFILHWCQSRFSVFLSDPQSITRTSRNLYPRLRAIQRWLDDENRVQNYEKVKETAISKGLTYFQSHYLTGFKPNVQTFKKTQKVQRILN